jgi:hypothetical protein
MREICKFIAVMVCANAALLQTFNVAFLYCNFSIYMW